MRWHCAPCSQRSAEPVWTRLFVLGSRDVGAATECSHRDPGRTRAAVASWGTMTSSSSMRSWFTHTTQPQVIASIDWTRCRLSRAELHSLRGFERSWEITLAKSTLQLFHSSPRSHMEDILASAPPEALDAMLTDWHNRDGSGRRAYAYTDASTASRSPAGKSRQHRTAFQRLCRRAHTDNFEPRRIRNDRGV
jgi:hypothetical protein